jgi:hypothetical protein
VSVWPIRSAHGIVEAKRITDCLIATGRLLELNVRGVGRGYGLWGAGSRSPCDVSFP